MLPFGGIFGFGEAFFRLPWSYLTCDEERGGCALGVNKELMASAPPLMASDVADFCAGYRCDSEGF